jgi:NAD(P)-dependent dehydrogenase (short-subunit alcohol dehydrogenase family)
MADLQAFDLDGQVAVVTGGNGGIGRAIAVGLAGSGVTRPTADGEASL